MKGYFYSAPDVETLALAAPSRFATDPDSGNVSPTDGITVRSTTGIWLSSPVLSEPDEEGNQTIITEGVRSDPYVIVSAEPIAALSAFEITPEGETLA